MLAHTTVFQQKNEQMNCKLMINESKKFLLSASLNQFSYCM